MEVKATIFANASSYKMKNKRIKVITLPSKNIWIESKMLVGKSEAGLNRSITVYEKDVIAITGIKFTPESALCIFLGLKNELEKSGLISVEKHHQ